MSRPCSPKRAEPADAPNSDALSSSSGFLHLLLHGDLCSATGSALSGSRASATSCSLGSGSLGCDASRSGPGMWGVPGALSGVEGAVDCVWKTPT